MIDLEEQLKNPVWYSLKETHKKFAVEYNGVQFYDPEVCPFGSFFDETKTKKASNTYLKSTDSFFFVSEKQTPIVDEDNIFLERKIEGCQMLLNELTDVSITEEIVLLGKEFIDEIYDLIWLVMPGYYKKRSFEMGKYFGIFKNGKLVSITGQRMQTNLFIEVSGVVTHPDYTGKGLARQLIANTTKEILKENKNNSIGNLRVLQYSGGEPLISREQFEFTNHIADEFGENIHLRYSTNLNNLKFEQYDVINLWKKFNKVHVKVSVDGIHDVYDYIRVGGSFDTLVKNIDILQSAKLDNVDLAFGFTTQIYNMFQLPEFLDFFTQYIDIRRITTYLLYAPNFMCVENYPADIKEKIILKLESSKWDFKDKILFLKNSHNNNSIKWESLLRYTKLLEEKNSPKYRFTDLIQKYL